MSTFLSRRFRLNKFAPVPFSTIKTDIVHFVLFDLAGVFATNSNDFFAIKAQFDRPISINQVISIQYDQHEVLRIIRWSSFCAFRKLNLNSIAMYMYSDK